jgi:hypothetical protein
MGNHSGSQDLNRPMDLSGTAGFGKAFIAVFIVGMVLFGVTFGMLLSDSAKDVPALKKEQAERAAAAEAAKKK